MEEFRKRFSDLEAETVFLVKEVEGQRKARLAAEAVAERAAQDLHLNRRGLELLQAITMAANESATIKNAMETALGRISEYGGWQIGHVYLEADDGTSDWVPLGVWHCDDPQRFAEFREVAQMTRIPAGTGLPGRVASTGRPSGPRISLVTGVCLWREKRIN